VLCDSMVNHYLRMPEHASGGKVLTEGCDVFSNAAIRHRTVTKETTAEHMTCPKPRQSACWSTWV